MQRLVPILVLVVVLVAGCASLDNKNPSITPANEDGIAVEGYPAAHNQSAEDTNPDNRGYPAQGESATETGSNFPSVEITDIVEKLASQAPTPKQGAGSIYGALYSVTNQATVPNTMVYLVQASGDGSESLPGIIVGPSTDDVILHSDQNGMILKDDIPPGSYYLIMSAPPYDWAEGYADEEAEESLLIQVRENEKTNMGIIYVFWP